MQLWEFTKKMMRKAFMHVAFDAFTLGMGETLDLIFFGPDDISFIKDAIDLVCDAASIVLHDDVDLGADLQLASITKAALRAEAVSLVTRHMRGMGSGGPTSSS